MSYEADVTEMMKYVKKLNENVTDKSKKITVNTVMMKIICEGLKAAPKMNATLDFNRKLVRGSLHYHDNIDVSMPMMLHTGEMMTVNMHDMGNKSLSEMTAAINDTVRRANNSDMNEVMFEGFTAQKCPASTRCTLFRAMQKKNIIPFRIRIGLPRTISSKEQPPFQTSAQFTEIKRAFACCLK